MSSSYFVITSSEDGISIEGPFDAKRLRNRIAEHRSDYDEDPEFYDSMPDIDKGCFMESGDGPSGMLVIRGEIYVPRPVARVTEFEVDE